MPGKTSATWPKGKKPPVQKPKGAKAKKTLIKEAIGLQNWDGLVEFMEKEGATKMMKEMKKLTGKSYTMAYNAMSEYVKPKLARQEVKAELKGKIAIDQRPVVFK
jgi:hypothetical protein